MNTNNIHVFVSIPTCAWVLRCWSLSLSPNVFLQFSSHYGWETRKEKNHVQIRVKRGNTVSSDFWTPLYASSCMCVYDRGCPGRRFNMIVVLSELKEGLFQRTGWYPALQRPLPSHSISTPASQNPLQSHLFSSFPSPTVVPPALPSITDLGALRVIFISSAGDVTSDADTNGS